MRITINVHCETAAEAEAVVAHLGRMPSAELPVQARGSPPRESEDDEAPPPPKPPRPAPKPANNTGGPMTGSQLLDWVNGHPDKQAALKRVQSTGKRLGYGWQVKTWKPQEVADVVREMAAHGRMGGKT